MIAFMLVSVAQAGWLMDVCERIGLVAEDPTQYEAIDETWIKREIDRIKIRQAWNCARKQDLRTLKVLESEMSRPHRCAQGLGQS